MRDRNILMAQSRLVDMRQKSVKSKRGKGSFTRKEKHKKQIDV